MALAVDLVVSNGATEAPLLVFASNVEVLVAASVAKTVGSRGSKGPTKAPERGKER